MNAVENPSYNLSFLKGLFYLWEGEYKQARKYFFAATSKTDHLEVDYALYQSYLGLTDVLNNSKSGLMNCYESTESSPNVFQVWFNLSCAEFLLDNRRRSILAIEEISELKLSISNNRLIHSFFDIVGEREKNSQGKMLRKKLINKSMGKMFRSKETIDLKKLETFIKKTVKTQYKDIIDEQYKSGKFK